MTQMITKTIEVESTQSRKILQIGELFCCSLPISWVRLLHLHKGSSFQLELQENQIIIRIPQEAMVNE